ncbi:MAG TPA: triple tyrosine motif-containing protein [Cyclobacteriaceae bacterium]|nr:triple tyrosine motif-containing protein [Cyclobacteriaceae bacterium]
MKFIPFLLLAFIATGNVLAQNELRVKRITTSTGEDIVGVQSFFKDSQGYMWMGSLTFDLVRFDGLNTRSYAPSEIQTDYFKSTRPLLIFEDSKKELWIGTDVGALMIYDRPMDRFQIVNDSTTSIKSRLFCQVEDKDGSFWLGTLGGGLLRFNPDTKKFSQYQFQQDDLKSIPDNYVVGLTFDSTGKLWVGTTAGLCSYDPQTNQFIRYDLPNNNPNDTYRYRVIRSMLLSKNKLYLSTYGGLQIFDIVTKKSEHLIHDDQNPNSLSHNSLFQTAENLDGTFWIASYGGGLSLFDPATRKFTNWKKDESDPESISSNNLFTVYLDGDGLLWMGMDDNTICIHNTRAKKFHSIVHRPGRLEGISPGWIQTIFQENDSLFWLGLNGNGLNRLNLNTGVVKKFLNDPKNLKSLGQNSVRAIDQDTQNRIWLGLAGGGINMLDPAKEEFTRFEAGGENSINNNAVSAMLIDQDDFIWTTTFRSGLNIYNPRTKKFKRFNNDSLRKATGISFAFVKEIFELNENIWFNTQTQVVVFDKKRNQFVMVSPEGQVAPATNSVFLEMEPYSETEMLLFTNDEVKTIRYVEPGHIKQKLIHKRKPNDEFFKSFVVDRTNQIWYITKDHLVKWNSQSGEKRIYTESDGIISSDLHSLFLDTRGRIFITTLNGLTWFSPNEIQDDTVQRKIIFTDFKLYNRSVGITEFDSLANYTLPGHISQLKNISIDHEHSFFSIEFTAMEFMAPNKIQYAYKLDGFDQEWVQIGNRNFASYTNLDPGNYTFQVKAANPDGFWGNQIASISIIINPPFWQTWWFIVLIILLIGGLIYFGHLYRLSQSLKIERLRTKIASDLHDEVGSSLTRISIYSDLLQNGNNESERTNYLGRISAMSREIVSTMSDIVWSIDNRSDTASALLFRMKDFATELLQPKNIQFDFKVSGIQDKTIMDPILRQNIYLIFKESINNIVKHADASLVVVDITNDSREFKMTIKDNGKGFIVDQNQRGNGLKNMDRRAHAIQGLIEFTNLNGTQVIFTRKAL